MADDKIVTLAKRIQERTKEGALRWEVTARENTFQVAFPESVVQISRWLDSRGREGYALRILNAEGLVLEDITEHTLQDVLRQSMTAHEGFLGEPSPEMAARRIMEDIYTSARRIALGTDRALEDLIKRLGGKLED
jgi:hypothetical protein